MFEAKPLSSSGSKRDFYASLAQQLTGLLEGEPDAIANAANMSALIYQLMPDLNWAGFYFMRGPGLVLGPFQGKVARVRIPVGRGVCGSAVERKELIVVPDVHAFPGHIACDSASRSGARRAARQERRSAGRARSRQPEPEPVRRGGSRGLRAAGCISISQPPRFPL